MNFDSYADLTQATNVFVEDYPDFISSDLPQEIVDFKVLVNPEKSSCVNADFLIS